MTRFVELSHPIAPGMETYPGLPGPAVSDFLSRDASAARYATGTTFQIGRIDMIANTGTYVDAPFHRFEGGTDIAALPLARLADVEGTVLDASVRSGRAIGPDAFAGRALEGKAVLVRTDWARHWGTRAYFEGHPFLTRSAAEVLVASAPALVGIDSMNIDDADDGRAAGPHAAAVGRDPDPRAPLQPRRPARLLPTPRGPASRFKAWEAIRCAPTRLSARPAV